MANKQRYFIQLAYNGANYHGWQVQQNAVSVQELLNKALSTLLRQPVETTGCGRTDTGVHAKEYFAHFDFVDHSPLTIEDSSLSIDHSPLTIEDSSLSIDHSPLTIDIAQSSMNHEPSTMDSSSTMDHEPSSIDYRPSTMNYKLKRSLNALLPQDIAVKAIIPVHADAHARFDATLRSYEYHIHFEKDPFLNGYSWLLRDKPDLDSMNRAAAIIMEYTDFSCFSKSNTQVKTNNCKIVRAEWLNTANGIVFHICADRFLRNMVRAIVGTLLLTGKGEIAPEDVRKIIESKNRGNAGMSVPACGLYLTQIKYPYINSEGADTGIN